MVTNIIVQGDLMTSMDEPAEKAVAYFDEGFN
jgi:hypothetical protein